MPTPTHTLGPTYQHLRQRLRPVCRSEAQTDAEACLILESLLGHALQAVYTHPEIPLAPRDWHRLEALLQQRVDKRIPVQYLLHRAWFFGLPLYVNPSVLIPRPETEILVEAALAVVQPGMRVADIGTGPGSIILALAHRLAGTQPPITCIGTDLSEAALQVARINQRALGVAVTWAHGDGVAPLATEEPVHVLLCNPPYIAPDQADRLDPEVGQHEPALALFSPVADPYYHYERLAREAPAVLQPQGQLMVEVGAGMAERTLDIFRQAHWKAVRVIPDYAQIDRIVIVERPKANQPGRLRGSVNS